MEATPDTFNYMVGGYIVFAVIMSVYIGSLISRWKNLKSEQRLLEDIESQKK